MGTIIGHCLNFFRKGIGAIKKPTCKLGKIRPHSQRIRKEKEPIHWFPESERGNKNKIQWIHSDGKR